MFSLETLHLVKAYSPFQLLSVTTGEYLIIIRYHRLQVTKGMSADEAARIAQETEEANLKARPRGVYKPSSDWWFQTFFMFTPIWGRFPIWLIFFRWVETTNQSFSSFLFGTRGRSLPDVLACLGAWFVSIYRELEDQGKIFAVRLSCF